MNSTANSAVRHAEAAWGTVTTNRFLKSQQLRQLLPRAAGARHARLLLKEATVQRRKGLPRLLTLTTGRRCVSYSRKPLGAGLMHQRETTTIHAKNEASSNRKTGTPDITELSPQLQQEWHPDNSLSLGDIKVKAFSHRKVMWRCNQCPAGQPHIWVTSVSNRTNGHKCPYCQGRRLCVHNSLATVAPGVARYWDCERNVKSPEETLAGSNASAEWNCPDCEHKWERSIKNRVRDSAGCPRCDRLRKTWNKHPTFEAAQHHLLSEWDHERNASEDIYPHNTTLGSGKLVHWICRQCPKGQLHRWRARSFSRTCQRPCGCPVCDGKQVCICNSLETLHPEVAAELDLSKNHFTAADVTASSHQVAWWKTDKRGSWKDVITQRTEHFLQRGKR